ncbi:hypothetical protein EYZ11_001258 [Aspergillus tanneri]|uniref:Uncharacterized protein n=1 Tax=Aspergillus tanneri TaxID=1220188 RepID=A0A4S3JV11_9EURO|nr:hypothetical protein EYZ11_001258 [Aspergillus tanneri]
MSTYTALMDAEVTEEEEDCWTFFRKEIGWVSNCS